MNGIWIVRIKWTALGLGLASLAAFGLSVVLSAAGDAVGGQAARGFGSVVGLAFVASLLVLAARMPAANDSHAAEKR
jgi:hypothetical protein